MKKQKNSPKTLHEAAVGQRNGSCLILSPLEHARPLQGGASELQRRFEEKNALLGQRFVQVSPEEYLSRIFGEKEVLVVVLGSTEGERGTVIRVPYTEVWQLAWRDNAYIPYADFHRNYYHSRTLKSVRAFVVDVDGADAVELEKLMRYVWGVLPAEPSYVVNSGVGVHFVYALSRPVEVQGLRYALNELNRRIQEAFAGIGRLDKHPLVHPYRWPGFRTKIGTTATAFQAHGHYDIEELLEVFGVKADKPVRKRKEQGVLYLPRGKRAFFEWVLRRLFRNPPIPGRRHNSFFALGIIAYKCKREVPREEAREAVEMVYCDIVRYRMDAGFSLEEAYEAFEKGYNPKAVTVTWKYLCELLGWEYMPNKRNKRSRQDHLKYMSAIRKAKVDFRRNELLPRVVRLRAEGRSLREIAREVGVSKNTVARWLNNLSVPHH
ncbi:regulatory protein LacI (plasmid) [Ammonifex degensii KC4]|uniref:Regulatory protein LacI n=1 Tax=Ammonifex degensii (strain DSM 10501 / KC4) TaxID=429009 RepID=C9RDH8_AMMDK|nr:helix-turn-helix domain-containing protein [Ammonifex degensii]ACX53249.1 regulatory protein LacI [Ammonifex degensii KC4]